MFKILVVDDDAGLRFSIKSAFSAFKKFEVAEAFDGINAIEKVKANSYSLVLLDVDMPRLDGLEAFMRDVAPALA